MMGGSLDSVRHTRWAFEFTWQQDALVSLDAYFNCALKPRSCSVHCLVGVSPKAVQTYCRCPISSSRLVIDLFSLLIGSYHLQNGGELVFFSSLVGSR